MCNFTHIVGLHDVPSAGLTKVNGKKSLYFQKDLVQAPQRVLSPQQLQQYCFSV